MKNANEYETQPVCPKCSSEITKEAFCEGPITGAICEDLENTVEHIHVQCLACNYVWLQKTESGDKTDLPTGDKLREILARARDMVDLFLEYDNAEDDDFEEMYRELQEVAQKLDVLLMPYDQSPET